MNSKTSLKSYVKPNFLDEAKLIGYMEGYSDGRLFIINELEQLKLLKKNWKKTYNKNTKNNYIVK
jgi:hypothetical protein